MSDVKPFRSGQPPSTSQSGIRGEYRTRTMSSAAIAARVRERMLECVEQKLLAAEDPDEVLKMLTGDTLRLLTDAENRGFGTPRQSVEVTGRDGAPVSMIHSAMTPEQAAEEYRKSLDESA